MTTVAHRLQAVTPSATLAITARAKEMRAQGVDVISLAAGEPDFDTPQAIKQAAVESLARGETKYTPASGLPALRQAISTKLAKDNHLTYTPEEIIVSCGAKHALFNIFQALLNAEDEVLIPAPYWLSYPEMVRIAQGIPCPIETRAAHGFKVTPQALQAAITPRTKAIIMNSPANPTGVVYTADELTQLAQVIAQTRALVISDEIYEEFIFDGLTHVSIGALGILPKEQVAIVNGVSKTYAMTGWRIGYVACEAELARAIGSLQSHSTSNPTSFAQAGALAAFQETRATLTERCKTFEKRRDLIFKHVASMKRLTAVKPQGAFYLFCGIGETTLSSQTFAQRLLEEARVAVIPGIAFGADAYVRLSFATSEQHIIEGIRRLKQWVESLS